MLRACHRVLRPGGRLAFYTIEGRRDATPAERAEFLTDGYSVAEAPYPEMMARAGFVDVTVADLGAAYVATAAAWLAGAEDLAGGLAGALGAQPFAEKQERRRRHLRAARQGVTTRVLVTGRRPG